MSYVRAMVYIESHEAVDAALPLSYDVLLWRSAPQFDILDTAKPQDISHNSDFLKDFRGGRAATLLPVAPSQMASCAMTNMLRLCRS